MATNANWTVICEDKKIIKNSGDGAGTDYVIDDNTFWSQSKFSNIWAIQHGTTPSSDEVEHRDSTPHSAYDEGTLGSFQDFIDKWDAAHLAKLQADWDADTREESEKGARPTSYSS
jgi:hypothetical protein|tara:strand:+ start:30 stop:377 length:348 start_codon:yes stop_codon:yes gene_type:complete